MIDSSDVSCVITLYNPAIDSLNKIESYSKIFKQVFIFDNTEKQHIFEVQEKLTSLNKNKNIIYINEGKNQGLAIAFNKIINLCKTDYLCTMDQDSYFSENDIKVIIYALNNKPSNACIIAPKVIYDNSNFKKNDRFVKKNYVITSGSFLDLHLFKKNNITFDENYFIDRLDVDICKQIESIHYSSYEYEGAVLYQQLGENNGHKHSSHNVLRHYYIFRNRFYFNNKYYSYQKKVCLNIFQTLKHIVLIILFEDDKLNKIKIFFKAYKDYKKGNMGSM